jgi:hypothetical protein
MDGRSGSAGPDTTPGAGSGYEPGQKPIRGDRSSGDWMRGHKAFGERIAARDPDRQTAEIQIRVALMNRVNTLGTAAILCVG